MKKHYQIPAIMVVKVDTSSLLQNSIQSNADLKMGGGGSGPARGRQSSSWNDDDE